MKGIFTFLFITLISYATSAQQTLEEFRNEVTGSTYTDYYLHAPSDDGSSKGLIVFLHGNGPSFEANKDNGWDRVLIEGMPLAMTTTNVFNGYINDYYVLIPHHHFATQGDDEWKIGELRTLIGHVMDEWLLNEADDYPPVDTDRIVVVGFSVGGKGAWDYANTYYDELAGAMPAFGSALPDGTNGLNWCDMDELPIWAINGAEDGTFPKDGTSVSGREGVNRVESEILTCNPDAPFVKTILDGRNHFGWNELFKMEMGFPIYDWMTTMQKGITDYEPVVSVGSDKTILSSSTEYIVHGFAADYLNDNLIVEWSVTDVTGTLDIPTVKIKEATSKYVYIEDLQADSDVSVIMRVSDDGGTTWIEDEMILTVTDALDYVGPTISNIRMLYDANNIAFPTTDFFDINQVTNHDSFNVLATVSAGQVVTSELNEARRYNWSSQTNFNYEQNLFGNVGASGAQLQLFEAGRQRLTFTMNIYTGTTYRITYQVSALFSDTPLPITLLSFTGKAEDQGVRLDWSTTEEVGNSHFEIFRGRSGDDLAKIAEVDKAPPGNLYNYYNYTDPEATDGIYYYQLQSVDFDGHRDISDIIRVALTAGPEFTVYPNPAMNGTFQITFAEESQPPVLMNASGQRVSYSLGPSPNGPGERQIILDNPRPGMYMLQGWHLGEQVTRKLIVE